MKEEDAKKYEKSPVFIFKIYLFNWRLITIFRVFRDGKTVIKKSDPEGLENKDEGIFQVVQWLRLSTPKWPRFYPWSGS